MFGMGKWSKSTLLNELEAFNYYNRIKEMALLSRNHKKNKKLAKLLISLADGNEYEAQLALKGAQVSDNIEVILKCLSHSASDVKIKAASLAAEKAGADEIKNVLQKLSYNQKKVLFKRLAKLNRTEVIDEILKDAYKNYGLKMAGWLFKGASREIMEKYCSEFETFPVKLVKENPEFVFLKLSEKLKNSSGIYEKEKIWRKYKKQFKMLVFLYTDEILDLLINTKCSHLFSELFKKEERRLVKKNSDLVFKVIKDRNFKNIGCPSDIPEVFYENYKLVFKDDWITLGKKFSASSMYSSLYLDKFPMYLRSILYKEIFIKDEKKNDFVNSVIVEKLPDSFRKKEAERMLELDIVSESVYTRMDFISCLPIEDSRKALEDMADSSDVMMRQSAYTALIKSTCISKEGMNETLKFLCRIKNDQDIVKKSVFSALKSSSPSLFDSGSVEFLKILVDTALTSQDISYDTLNEIQQFLLKLVHNYQNSEKSRIFEFALDASALIYVRNKLSVSFDFSGLKHGIENKFYNKISSYIEREAKQENFEPVLRAASLFKERGTENAKLQKLLKEALLNSENLKEAEEISKWYLFSPQKRDEKTREILNTDRSFIMTEAVRNHAVTRSQDLLDPHLISLDVKGHLKSARKKYLIEIKNFKALMPFEDKIFFKLLQKTALNSREDINLRIQAVKMACRIKNCDNFKFVKKTVENKNEEIQKVLLLSLKDFYDSCKASEILLNYLEEDNSKYAIQSLKKCIKNITPKEEEKIIKMILENKKIKISPKKEIIRILSDIKSEDNFNILMDLAKRTDVHKDVKKAVIAGVAKYPEKEKSWEILNRIAEGNDIEDISVLFEISPEEIESVFRKKYLDFLTAVLEKREELLNDNLASLYKWKETDSAALMNFYKELLISIKKSKSAADMVIDFFAEIASEGGTNNEAEEAVKILTESLSREESKNNNEEISARYKILKLKSSLIPICTGQNAEENQKKLLEDIAGILKENDTLKEAAVEIYASVTDWKSCTSIIKNMNKIEVLASNKTTLMEKARKAAIEAVKNNNEYDTDEVLKAAEKLKNKSFFMQHTALCLLEELKAKQPYNSKIKNMIKEYTKLSNDEIKSMALNLLVLC